MDVFLLPLLILPFILFKNSSSGSSKGSSGSTNSNIPNDIEKIGGIPFALGINNPLWPIISKNSKNGTVSYLTTKGNYVGTAGYAFGKPRSGGSRIHIGMDLWANAEDIVVAMEDGKIVGIQGFLGPVKAMLVEGISGLVVLYGEIKDNSWSEFGLKEGDLVKRGQKIARVGKNEAGGAMLHLETYRKGTTKNITWKKGTQPDPRILNPTKYLLKAKRTLSA